MAFLLNLEKTKIYYSLLFAFEDVHIANFTKLNDFVFYLALMTIVWQLRYKNNEDLKSTQNFELCPLLNP